MKVFAGGEEWERITEVLAQACEIAEPERRAWLDQQDASEAMRSRVIELLEVWQADPNFLDLQQSVPEKIGPWVLGKEIGRGGMGRVFEAVHEDPIYARRVALKIIGSERFTPILLEAFMQERAILARLEHSAIARLYDIGRTLEGIPYFAMEYVDGVCLDQWLARENPSAGRRLGVLLAIMDAVSYSHQKFVAHGDLKPGNILVTAKGDPLVLDFGIARMLNQSSAGQLPLLTPNHASPEQIAGEPITAASDIYQLGLMIRESIPNADGEVRAIAERCVRQRPSERYLTVEALVADLRAWMEHRPVSVVPPTLVYRAYKQVRRNPFGAAFLVAMVAGLLGTSWQAYQAEQQRRENLKHFQETSQFTRKLLDGVVNVPAVAQAAMVKNTVQMLEKMGTSNPDNPELLLEIAYAWKRLGMIQGVSGGKNLGDKQSAISSLQRAMSLAEQARGSLPKESLKLLVDLYGNALITEDQLNHKEQVKFYQGRLEGAIQQLEQLKEWPALGNAYSYVAANEVAQDRAKSISLYKKAIAAYERAGDKSLANRAYASKRLGAIYLVEKRFEEGAKQYEEALAIERAIQAPPLNISYTLSDLAWAQRKRNRYPEAIAGYREALAIRESAYRDDPDDQRTTDALASLLYRLGRLLGEAGQIDESLTLLRRALVFQKKFAREAPANALFQKDLAWVNIVLAKTLAESLPKSQSASARREMEACRQAAIALCRRFPTKELLAELKLAGMTIQ